MPISSIFGIKELLKLANLDFTTAILIDFGYQLLDVYGHLEVLLDDPNELIGINAPTSVLISP